MEKQITHWFTIKDAKAVGPMLGLNWKKQQFTPTELARGMNIELEHGKMGGAKTNVTNDDMVLTARIALAHLLERPDYYSLLERFVENAPQSNPREKKWKLYPEVQKRQQEEEKQRKKRTRYVVVLHSEGKEYVVRPGEIQADGSIALPSPYQSTKQLQVCLTEGMAQRFADKLNGR